MLINSETAEYLQKLLYYTGASLVLGILTALFLGFACFSTVVMPYMILAVPGDTILEIIACVFLNFMLGVLLMCLTS